MRSCGALTKSTPSVSRQADDMCYTIGVKRTRTLRQWMGLVATVPEPLRSKPHPEHRMYPYLLREMSITAPNQVWASNIIYIVCRKVLLTMWGRSFTDSKSGIFNTDQGVQYTSENYIKTLESHSIQISMDGCGRALDNIMIERLWRTVKYEEVYLKDYENVSERRRSLCEDFVFYNRKRRHSNVGDVPERKYRNC